MGIRRERDEVTITKQACPEREHRPLVLRIHRTQKERVTAVFVADDRPGTVGPAEEPRSVHLRSHSITRRVGHGEAERAGEEEIVEVELRGVLVAVSYTHLRAHETPE